MSGVVRNKAAAAAGAGAQQPPRPPNAWILYRSDKLQELPPPPLGHPKPTQAEVSKIISAQWRTETEDVRALYEQRAEMAKAEHARLYPNYRFAPMKKAEKDRIREEKRQAREQERAGRRVRGRVAPYPPPYAAPPFNTSVPLSIRHVFPNAPSTSPSTSSAPSPSPITPPSQPCVGVASCHGSARVSPDAFIDLQLPPVKSQTPSSHESSRVGVCVPLATPLPVVPPRLALHTPQPPPPKGWQPSPSDSPTTFPVPPGEISLPDWPQILPQSTQISHEARITCYSLALRPVFLMFFIDWQPSFHNPWFRSFIPTGYGE
jgi:HMG (high mobility group) box